MRLKVSSRPLEADNENYYPDSDGRPVGETPIHFRNAAFLKQSLDIWFAQEPQVFLAANMFVYYVPGNRLKHVSPDLFVARGVAKDKPRRRYLMWDEGKGPDLVIELTSESTRDEDVDKKWLYRDFLGVREYVLFDPFAEYLDPPLQGFLLQEGEDVQMPLVSGRLVSQVLGLHFEANGEELRLYDPAIGRWLRTPPEEHAFAAEMAAKLDQTTIKLDQTVARLDQTVADKARLEQELAELRRRLGPDGSQPRRE